jgi:hypothetical protein
MGGEPLESVSRLRGELYHSELVAELPGGLKAS